MNISHHNHSFVKIFLGLLLFGFLTTGLIYWTAGSQMEAITSQTDSVLPSVSDGGLSGTSVLEQAFLVETDTVDSLDLYIWTFGRTNHSTFRLELLEGETVLWSQECDTAPLKNTEWNTFPLETPLQDMKGKLLQLRISTQDVPSEECVSFYYGNTVSASKVDIAVEVAHPLYMNGQPVDGMLCFSVTGRNHIALKALYWPAILVITALFSLAYWVGFSRWRKGKNGIFSTCDNLSRYGILMKQLVARDFKTKYKRSVLGVLWSFFNPLLTMCVQYLVFASLFKSNVDNYAVYLMSGGILFNFFSEAVSLGLMSIIWNSSLITKVYVPKYIYPVSRVLSSAVNVIISMIPLCMIILLSGIPLRKSMLLIPLVLFYTTLSCIGMSLLLSSAMVFFRDTQFLWNVLSMLWMYLTPIFYPETIIPQKYLWLYHMNPMYQFIYFLRTITINGTAPGPNTFLYCTLCAVVPLLLGLWVFRKTQDRFVFYL